MVSFTVSKLAPLCIAKADRAADSEGFVPIRKLLAEFQAELMLRPLLVEGMLASVISDQGEGDKPCDTKWMVLLDSEKFDVPAGSIESEDGRSALPYRLRNTVAHELAHSLSFRSHDFGVELMRKPRKGQSTEEYIQRIEAETERLSPLLLIPATALSRLPDGKMAQLELHHLVELRAGCAVSRELLVSRIRLAQSLDIGDPILDRLRNVAVGIGEWRGDGNPWLRHWPLFTDSRQVVRPELLWNLGRKEDVEIAGLCGSGFKPCEDHSCEMVRVEVRGGFRDKPAVDRIGVELAIEKVSRQPGSRFLFLLRAMQD